MKRDLDLIRKILETIEANNQSYGVNLEVEGYDLNTIAFHLVLLKEAGYVKANVGQAASGQYVNAWPERLTWDGYEFLELARNNSIWDKSKSVLKEKSMTLPFTLLVELLKSLAKEAIGLGH